MYETALFLLAMLLSALSSFSQIQLGATASYLPTAEYGSWGQPISMSILPVLGLESEYSTGFFELEQLALSAAFDTQSAQLILHTDIGISDRLAFINIGIGVGPSLVWTSATWGLCRTFSGMQSCLQVSILGTQHRYYTHLQFRIHIAYLGGCFQRSCTYHKKALRKGLQNFRIMKTA